MMRLAFFASHNGSSAKAITKACRDGTLAAEPVLLISNNPSCAAFDWAGQQGVETLHIQNGTDSDIAKALIDHKIDLGILSGYMKLIGPQTLAAAAHIINIHPALLPKYGGQGMYGRHVHEAVKQSGDTVTGSTIHLVNEVYDDGAILAQNHINIAAEDMVEDIESRVKNAEPDFYIATLKNILAGKIALPR